MLESHEARVKAAMERARSKAKHCAVTQQKPTAADRNPIELQAHHLFDAASRPDLAALEENLLVISSALHRNFHKWMGNRSWDALDKLIAAHALALNVTLVTNNPRDFVPYAGLRIENWVD